MLNKYNRLLSGFGKAGKLFISIVLMLMVLMVFVNAVARYGFAYNFPVFEEWSRVLFVWTAFLGAMIASFEKRHVGVDMLTNRLTGLAKLAVNILAQLIILVVLLVLIAGAFKYFEITAPQPLPATGVPFAVLSGAAVIMVLFMIGISLRDIFNVLKAYKNGEFAESVDKLAQADALVKAELESQGIKKSEEEEDK